MPHCFTHLTNCYCISIPWALFLFAFSEACKHLANERSSGKVNRFLINMEFSRGTRTLNSYISSSIDVVKMCCYRPSVLVTVYKSGNNTERANSRVID